LNSRKLIVKIIENWPVKVLSIVLAFILFVFHHLNTMTTRPLSVPLAIETNSTLVPASAYPRSVRVTLRGEDNSIQSIADNDIEAYVDLTKYESEGLYNAPIQIRKKDSALDIEPLEIVVYPLKISVQLDRKITKTLPLAAVIAGRVADGFNLISYSISPSEITVTGPFGLLESLAEIKTDPIDLDGRNTDFSMEVHIANPNPLLVLRGSSTGKFTCFINPTVSVRSIDGIAISLKGLNSDFEADTGGRTGNIRIEGNQLELDGFRPSPDFFIIDCSGISEPGTYTLPVMVDLPSDFLLIRYDPEDLIVTVTHRGNSEHKEHPF
jgi:YbbR domain-containing protein